MHLSPTMNNADLESPSNSMTRKARSIGGEKPIKKKSVGDKNCLFIDDSKENILAAQKLGVNTIHYLSHKQLVAELRKGNIL
ncbi:MAG: hypothetical protein GF308_14320 [Candidatus Heimdallarchaeota archaeon]|nr:hypothetical protein [Candidatus Heimdallarchaeota archaeon]